MRPIDGYLRQILNDLVIEQNAPGGWVPTDADREALVEELDDALVDTERLEPILEYLGSLPNKALQREESVFTSDEDVRAVLDGGLGALYARSAGLFYSAVVDPFALMELRDNVFDLLPPYWWEKIHRASGREPEGEEEIWARVVEEADSELMPTAFDEGAGLVRWTVTLGAGRVTRITPEGAEVPAVTIEFTLAPDPAGWRLVVDVFEPPPASDRRRNGRLLTPAGAEVARVEGAADLMTFTFGQDDARAGVEFHCDDFRGADDHIRYQTPVTPP